MSEVSNELKNIIEAAILVAEGPLSINQMLALFPGDAKPEKQAIVEVIEQLTQECQPRGIELKKVGNGYRYQSREKYAFWLRKLYEQKPPRYSRAVLETLAIIAYNQPVTRGDIEEIRGVAASTEIMRTLQARGWIKEVGFKDVPGRPALFATTREFLDYFNLKSIRELPALQAQRNFDEIAKEHQIQYSIVEDNLPPPTRESGQNLLEANAQDPGQADPTPRESNSKTTEKPAV